MSSPTPSSGDRSLSAIVNEDFRAASVFERFGLDYCCHGHQSLEEAARARGVPAADVIGALTALGAPTPDHHLPAEWHDLRNLTRHIVEHHHQYVRRAVPTVSAQLEKLVNRHGERHRELAQVRLTFGQLADELLTHMEKEENLLFPVIDEMAAAQAVGGPLPPGPFATALHPIRVMEADHALAGDLTQLIRRITGDFAVPADGCTTYRACYAELAHFEADLHRHIHLENNVLFPKALEIERALM